MNKIDYLKYCIKNGTAKKVHWVKSVLGIIRNASVKEFYPGVLKVEPWGLSFYNDEGTWEKIDDAAVGVPLFTIADRFTIDPSWLSSVSTSVETTVGRLLWNYYTVYFAFQHKFPYVNEKKSIGDIEEMILAKRQEYKEGEPLRDEFYYVDEYLKFHEGVLHLEHLSNLVVTSLTRKAVVPPDGLAEFKAGLMKKFEGKLHDPVELAKFKSELAAFDDQWRGDDPSKHFIKGKVKDNGRMRVHLTIGTDAGFENTVDVVPISNSLVEGWPTESKQYVTLMNGIRKGSYDRGSETVNGGVAAKVLLRAANHITVEDTDCGVPYGIVKTYTKATIGKLVGRLVISGGKLIPITNKTDAANYIGRPIQVRSPATCRLSGDKICKVCAGSKLSMYPTGLTIPLTEISNILLYDSMKSMHDSTLKVASYEINDVLS